ncbi:MAG: Rpn family recombination-promoting nuclease/putative transposase [Synergistaceae bacterium]|jgi:predicted transposase/invertase (TIGR01784 family)|nr:Rpn family recombination-promoting nuclease/putative transposase [Synergistaceae bacterium]
MREDFANVEVPEILPPSDDGVFKTLLTHPNARSCLRDIISSNIGLPVKEVTLRNTELPIGDILEKRERFDVSCEIDGGDQVEVEMQADPMEGDSLPRGHRNIKSRAIYNACDLHSGQKSVGVSYGRLARTYQITFCGYTIFENEENCFNRFSFRNAEGRELLNAVNIMFVELSKLKRVLKKNVDEMTGAEMWAIFLACANNPEHRELLKKIIGAREEIKMAYDLLTSISQDADERARFRARRKFQMDLEHNRLVSFEEGKFEGKLEVARKLLARGVSSDTVAQSTGLSPDKIRSLIN